jgi:hypothetical protein
MIRADVAVRRLMGNAVPTFPFADMMEFLLHLLWPIGIVVTALSIAVAVGVFLATRKLD